METEYYDMIRKTNLSLFYLKKNTPYKCGIRGNGKSDDEKQNSVLLFSAYVRILSIIYHKLKHEKDRILLFTIIPTNYRLLYI